MPIIEQLDALEILDSRGRPTVLATCILDDGTRASASVPSGASTGAAEAWELRDGDETRYGGLGCRSAVANVSGELRRVLGGENWTQEELDRRMIELDGTPNKSRLGANAILAVSLAFARAASMQRRLPLYEYFAELRGDKGSTLPQLTVNLFSGGKHAGQQVPIQDVLIAPIAAQTIDESLATTYAVYQSAAELIRVKYGMRLLRADEGGLAPPCSSIEELFDDAVQSIQNAGFAPGEDVALAVDIASSHFYVDEKYHLPGRVLDSRAMIATLHSWTKNYPIISVEDGLAENDWQHWPELRATIGEQCLVLGDDFLCTNPARIQRAIDSGACSALLLKVNQVGTLTEAGQACRLAKAAGWHVTVSARSGETEDNWLADLAVGWSGNHIKIGSITQSERLAKYNRLLEIEKETKFFIGQS